MRTSRADVKKSGIGGCVHTSFCAATNARKAASPDVNQPISWTGIYHSATSNG